MSSDNVPALVGKNLATTWLEAERGELQQGVGMEKDCIDAQFLELCELSFQAQEKENSENWS